MNPCETYWELMSCAMDGALTDEERRRLEGHLTQCPECREILKQMQNLHEDMPGVGSAPAGFVDGVMEKAAVTEQDIPFTNLPQDRDVHKTGRDSLKAWWKPITQWCAIAACFLIVCGVGTMANRSGLFSAENSTGASAPAADSCQMESQTVADEAVPGANEKPAAGTAEDGHSGQLEPDAAEDIFIKEDVLEWGGVYYINTGDTTEELPEGFALAGECSLLAVSSSQDGVLQVYAGGGDEIYILVGDSYQRWSRTDE